MQIQNSNKFDILPQAIKDWLVSMKVSDLIADINESHGFFAERAKVIASAITHLVSGTIQPQNFQNILSKNLKRNPETIGQIVNQIANKILAPVRGGLKTTQNIDLSPLFVSQPQKQSKSAPSVQATAPKQPIDSLNSITSQTKKPEPAPVASASTPQKSMSAFASMMQGSLAQKTQQAQQEKSESNDNSQRPVQDIELLRPIAKAPASPQKMEPSSQHKTQEAERPFMLHEETPKAPSAGNTYSSDFSFEFPQSNVPGKSEKPKAKASFGNFFNRLTEEKDAQQAPKVESKKETPKVVHYSAFRTLLGDPGTDKDNNN
jgi:hypothetical protein